MMPHGPQDNRRRGTRPAVCTVSCSSESLALLKLMRGAVLCACVAAAAALSSTATKPAAAGNEAKPPPLDGEKYASSAPRPASVFRLAGVFGDGMVLAAAPKRAMVWGFCEPGAKIAVVLDAGPAVAATVGPDHATGSSTTWRALLPATPASFANHTVTATMDGLTLTLSAVLFGEVWICSGQSNM